MPLHVPDSVTAVASALPRPVAPEPSFTSTTIVKPQPRNSRRYSKYEREKDDHSGGAWRRWTTKERYMTRRGREVTSGWKVPLDTTAINDGSTPSSTTCCRSWWWGRRVPWDEEVMVGGEDGRWGAGRRRGWRRWLKVRERKCQRNWKRKIKCGGVHDRIDRIIWFNGAQT